MKEPLPTHFAPASRASATLLKQEVAAVTNNALLDALMATVGGLVAVLNEQRQVLAVNHGMLRFLGLEQATEALGLRVGEAVHCTHAHEAPGGCGTSETCATCGQAIAQVTSLRENRAVETLCALHVVRESAEHHLMLRVRCVPFPLDGWRVLLVFLQDVTEHQRHAALERAFFHDVRNTLTALLGTGEMLKHCEQVSPEAATLAADVVQLCRRVAREVDLQRCLSESSVNSYRPAAETHAITAILRELHTLCIRHPAAVGRRLDFAPIPAAWRLETDATVLLRVLDNMVVNALEAARPGDAVRIHVAKTETHVIFSVWNPGAMPPGVARRVFQRNFSTKEGTGRGTGTFAMKLLGEQCLGGTVTFTSDETSGTCFRLSLPQSHPTPAAWQGG